MSTIVETGGPAHRAPRRPARRETARFAVEAVVLIAVAVGAVLGVRAATAHHTTAPVPASTGHVAAPPSNPAIEQAWGIKFTNAVLLADNGLVDLRYIVVNPSTASRIHSGAQNQPQLPTVRNERTGALIKPSAAVLHFHHGTTTADGRTYSVIYGNAGNALRSGDLVTIIMKDGLKLEHLQVTD